VVVLNPSGIRLSDRRRDGTLEVRVWGTSGAVDGIVTAPANTNPLPSSALTTTTKEG
jgi:hypothetical protein